MAGIFGLFDYTKPGKGVDKDERERKEYVEFFLILWRRLTRLLPLNMMYFTLTLPLFTYLSAFAVAQFPWLFEAENAGIGLFSTEFFGQIGFSIYTFSPVLAIGLVVVSAIMFGPVTAAMTYILRNFVRHEHAWIWFDFWRIIKENFVQSLIAGLVDIILMASVIIYASIDPSSMGGAGGFFFQLFRYIVYILFAIYEIMRFYIFNIMVTSKLKLGAIYKNAFILVVLGLPRNVVAVLACVPTILLLSILDIYTFTLIGYSLLGLIVIFTTYPVMRKYLIDPFTEAEEEDAVFVDQG